MQLAVITEIITHFAGLLHVPVEPDRSTARPDGAPNTHSGALSSTVVGHHHAGPVVPEPEATRPFRLAPHDGEHDPHFARWTSNQHVVVPKIHLLPAAVTSFQMPPPAPLTGGAGGDGGDAGSQPSSLWLGPDQTVIDDHQVNMLIGNTSYVDHVAGALPMPADVQLESMIQQAYSAIPADAPPLGYSDSQEIVLVKGFEDGLASGATVPAATLTPGTFVDGVATSSDGTPLAPSLPITSFDTTVPTGADVAQGQTIVLGQDTAANAALIVDTSAAPLTVVVEGNAYSADIIVQSNVVENLDQVAAGGVPGLATILGADSVHNTATFAELPNVVSATTTGGLGQTWNVTVVNGDLYDVNAVTQQNVLVNDSLYVGTPTTDHYYAVLGGNGQENALSITHDGPTYDLLVVLGGSYQANAIYQENVLSSNNTVGVSFSPTTGASDTLNVGGNTISNQASIETIGVQGWQPTSADLQGLVQSLLANGDAAGEFPGLPSYGVNVDVTIVTGNYYQFNLISQTNVIANSTSALADLTKAGAGTPASVITGVDTLANAATIVAAHALDAQYVTGQPYETSMLVQTNIVDAHAQVSTASAAALVPDLIAFLNSGNVSDVGVAPPAAPSAITATPHETTGHSVLA